MATQTSTIPTQDWPEGRNATVSFPLISRARMVEFEIARQTTLTPLIWVNPSIIITVELEASFDGGATWVGAGGFSAHGGIGLDERVTPAREVPFSGIRVPYPGRNAELRAFLTVSGGSPRTSVTIRSRDGDSL